MQLVLLAPVKLPGKALNVIKYIALGLGILEKMADDGTAEEPGSGVVEGDELEERGNEAKR
ncbi:hypothetical protein ORI89_05340 [Sphingobacterium sp. UT-1RO-CII-1]|uniref:hypothetical protein n=1 Tax=Sphingobacterium sp. UT-1RO-CII-1 TaxID=2995225 RepID=UPI00227AF29F|nr:hypothetical protein [Sphingobacterium sp. UT-1RO-CII-1]MCY4779063.1 hypothetical protein [Sphingobacterium sp. UT-1RO-CII-1]